MFEFIRTSILFFTVWTIGYMVVQSFRKGNKSKETKIRFLRDF